MVEVELDPEPSREELQKMEVVKRTTGSGEEDNVELFDVTEVDNEFVLNIESLKLLYFEHQMFNELHSPLKIDILRFMRDNATERTVSSDEIYDAVSDQYARSSIYDPLEEFQDHELVSKEGRNRWKYTGDRIPNPDSELIKRQEESTSDSTD